VSQRISSERYGLVVDIVPEKRATYLRLHSAVWPQVEQTLRDCNVTNYTIFILEDTLFAYYEYVGSDHAADMARIDQDPVSQEWWTHTDPCQVAFGREAAAGERWRALQEVWHLS
jgi:L-rhamnose mutarotase